MTPTYIGDIDLNEETLAHFGIKGMKWGKRKARLKGKALEVKTKIRRYINKYRNDDEITDKFGKLGRGFLSNYKYGDPKVGDLAKGIEAGRKRVGITSQGSNPSRGTSDGRKKESVSVNTRGQTTKWQPRTNAERTAKINDDIMNSKGGQELLKIYKRKKAMSSRKSTKA